MSLGPLKGAGDDPVLILTLDSPSMIIYNNMVS